MTANRSLDEFASPESEVAEPADDPDDDVAEATPEAAGGTDEVAPESAEPTDDVRVDGVDDLVEPDADDAPEDVTPATSTYVWSPDGGPCAACGGRAEERWREGDDLVCGDCKDW